MMDRRRALMAAQSHGSPYAHGTWEDLFWHIDNGVVSDAYALGESIPLNLGAQGNIDMQIVGFSADTLASSTDKAAVTFIGVQLLKTKQRMNPALSPSSAPYTEGTGTIGGWEKCEMRSYLQSAIAPLIPQSVSGRIVAVKKYSRIVNTSGTVVNNSQSSDELWIPSAREMGKGSGLETSGPTYNTIFASDAKRIKRIFDTTAASEYYVRTAASTNTTTNFTIIYTSGDRSYIRASTYADGVCLGFCVN